MRKLFVSLTLLMSATFTHADIVCGVPGDEAMSAVVRVVGNGVEGSGIVIARNRILTAAHVVEGLDDINIVHKGIKRSAAIVSTLPERDLALMIADTSHQKPIKMTQQWLSPRSQVWAVGFPLGGNKVATSGTIEAYAKGDVQTTASVNHGQSGGGLLGCENGQHVLAGMVRAFGALQKGNKLIRLDNYSVSVPTETISQFVSSSRMSANVIERFLLSSVDVPRAGGGMVATR